MAFQRIKAMPCLGLCFLFLRFPNTRLFLILTALYSVYQYDAYTISGLAMEARSMLRVRTLNVGMNKLTKGEEETRKRFSVRNEIGGDDQAIKRHGKRKKSN